jgi:hypothetical protein
MTSNRATRPGDRASRVTGFSLDRLLRLLNALGAAVEIRVTLRRLS